MRICLRRREFIAGLGGAAAWPLAADAQQGDSVKRVAWVGTMAEDAVTFGREITRLGWIEGRNVHVDYRVETDDQHLRATAPGIVSTAPDVIITVGSQHSEVFKGLTDKIPIVFNNVPDPVAIGLVASFAHPGGNITGFSNHQFSFAGKWLSILKELAADITDVMVLYEPANSNWQGFLSVLEQAAPLLRVTVRPTPAATPAEVVNHIEAFARNSGGGMMVLPTAVTVGNRALIAALAAHYRLPAIYPFKFFVTSGGLVSYGTNIDEQSRHTAQYADRILRGTKPADLPMQAPIAFEFVINSTAAKALGIQVPPALLAVADEIIE
jgi:putative ABC transport system substrate-binding protein